MLEDIHLYYVMPFEMSAEVSDFLRENYEISEYSLAFSEGYDFPLSQKLEKMSSIITSFYEMIETIGFEGLFKRNYLKWWKHAPALIIGR